MAVNKVALSDGTVLMDLTSTTATAQDVANGKIFYAADGTRTVGSAIDANTTYSLSMSNNIITLTGSDNNTSSVTLPVYNGEVSSI